MEKTEKAKKTPRPRAVIALLPARKIVFTQSQRFAHVFGWALELWGSNNGKTQETKDRVVGKKAVLSSPI